MPTPEYSVHLSAKNSTSQVVCFVLFLPSPFYALRSILVGIDAYQHQLCIMFPKRVLLLPIAQALFLHMEYSVYQSKSALADSIIESATERSRLRTPCFVLRTLCSLEWKSVENSDISTQGRLFQASWGN